MGKIFNWVVESFVHFFNEVINNSFFTSIARLVDDFFTYLPVPLHYALALVALGTVFYLVKNIASFILELVKP